MSLLLVSSLIALAAGAAAALARLAAPPASYCRIAAPPASYCRLASISINCRPTRLEFN